MKEVKTFQVGDKLVIVNGVDPIRYVDLTKNKVHQYKPNLLNRIKNLFRKSKLFNFYYKVKK